MIFLEAPIAVQKRMMSLNTRAYEAVEVENPASGALMTTPKNIIVTYVFCRPKRSLPGSAEVPHKVHHE